MHTEMPSLKFRPVEPLNLLEVLEAQARRLIAIGTPKQVGVNEAKYLDDAMTVASQFVWQPKLAEIELSNVALVDYRSHGQFLAEAGGVHCGIDPDKCTLYDGIALPDGITVAQFQWGSKYKGKSPRWYCKNSHPSEQGGTVKEGLTGLLYGGRELLRRCYMDLPGSVSPRGFVPCLCLCDEKPSLLDDAAVHPFSLYGSVSRGR